MAANSEQELRQLLDEGKIRPDEYQQLLTALGQKKKAAQTPQTAPIVPQTPAKPRSRCGNAALILFVASILLPLLAAVLTVVVAGGGHRTAPSWAEMGVITVPLVLLGILCAVLAFIFGIIGWKSATGKTAVIAVTIIGIIALLMMVPGLLLVTYRASAREIPVPPVEVMYPLDSLEGVRSKDGVEYDPSVSSDGHGSLKLTQSRSERIVYPLFETGPLGIVGNRLIYEAKVKSLLSEGKAYLEMWCEIGGKGEFFSRQLDQPISGRTDWVTTQAPFQFEPGQSPANVKLNLVIEGSGTVWIDDIQLIGATN